MWFTWNGLFKSSQSPGIGPTSPTLFRWEKGSRDSLLHLPMGWTKHSILSGGDEISSRFSGSRVCAHCSAMSLSITAAADQEMSMKTRAESLMSTDGKQEPAGRRKRPMVIGCRVWEKRLKLRSNSRVAWENNGLVYWLVDWGLFRKMVSFPNLCALGDGCTMKENALKYKAIDSNVKQMHMMLGTERIHLRLF